MKVQRKMGLKNRFIGAVILLLAVMTVPTSSLNFDLAVDLGMFDKVVPGDDFLAFTPNKDASHAWMYVNPAADSV